jgi:Flp pilus assembly pilin Flp
MIATRMNSMLSEDGQNIVEYTLMIGLVVLVIWVGISVFNIPASVTTIWSNVNTQVTASAS